MFKIPVNKMLGNALADGANFAEIFVETTTVTTIVHEDKKIERASIGTDFGFGLRTITGEKTVYTSSNNLKKNSNNQTNFSAIKEKARLVERAAAAAWNSSCNIKQVQVVWRDSKRSILIENSKGIRAEDDKNDAILVVHVTAEKDGVIQTSYEPVGGNVGLEYFIDHSPEHIASTIANRAILMLKASPAPRGTTPVVISSEAGGTIVHEAVGHGLEADLVLQGVSVYKDKIGKKVASKLITVVDDATVAKCRGTFLFDDEGSPAQRTALIEEGFLKSYMHSLDTALKMGAKPTGNGRRESYRNRPVVRMTNTIVAPGYDDPNSIIASVERGLFVKKMGGGQVNTLNGDFVFEAMEAYLIENGKICEPVRGAMLIGNGPQVLMEIDMVGTDLGYGLGTCGKEGQATPVGHGMPTIRVPKLTVGGKG